MTLGSRAGVCVVSASSLELSVVFGAVKLLYDPPVRRAGGLLLDFSGRAAKSSTKAICSRIFGDEVEFRVYETCLCVQLEPGYEPAVLGVEKDLGNACAAMPVACAADGFSWEGTGFVTVRPYSFKAAAYLFERRMPLP